MQVPIILSVLRRLPVRGGTSPFTISVFLAPRRPFRSAKERLYHYYRQILRKKKYRVIICPKSVSNAPRNSPVLSHGDYNFLRNCSHFLDILTLFLSHSCHKIGNIESLIPSAFYKITFSYLPLCNRRLPRLSMKNIRKRGSLLDFHMHRCRQATASSISSVKSPE